MMMPSLFGSSSSTRAETDLSDRLQSLSKKLADARQKLEKSPPEKCDDHLDDEEKKLLLSAPIVSKSEKFNEESTSETSNDDEEANDQKSKAKSIEELRRMYKIILGAAVATGISLGDILSPGRSSNVAVVASSSMGIDQASSPIVVGWPVVGEPSDDDDSMDIIETLTADPSSLVDYAVAYPNRLPSLTNDDCDIPNLAVSSLTSSNFQTLHDSSIPMEESSFDNYQTPISIIDTFASSTQTSPKPPPPSVASFSSQTDITGRFFVEVEKLRKRSKENEVKFADWSFEQLLKFSATERERESLKTQLGFVRLFFDLNKDEDQRRFENYYYQQYLRGVEIEKLRQEWKEEKAPTQKCPKETEPICSKCEKANAEEDIKNLSFLDIETSDVAGQLRSAKKLILQLLNILQVSEEFSADDSMANLLGTVARNTDMLNQRRKAA